jgi:hypothetical protein
MSKFSNITRADRAKNLGKLVTELRAASVSDIDWEIAGWGDCTGLLAKDELANYNRVARRHGFADLEEAKEAIELRTSAKWVHFNLGL